MTEEHAHHAWPPGFTCAHTCKYVRVQMKNVLKFMCQLIINRLWISSGGSPCEKLTWASVSRLNKSFQLFVYLFCVLGFSFVERTRFASTPPILPSTHPIHLWVEHRFGNPCIEALLGCIAMSSCIWMLLLLLPLEIFPRGEGTAFSASSWFFPMTRELCTQCIWQWRKAETPHPNSRSADTSNVDFSESHTPEVVRTPSV